MARFAPVAPVQILEEMLAIDKHFLGDYHLLLAHETVKKPGEFYKVFNEVSDEFTTSGVIIMDNSVVETGQAVDLGMVREATNIMQSAAPTWRVLPCLPDVMGKGQETRDAIRIAYPDWDRDMTSNAFMAIAQGDDLGDFCDTINYLFVEDPSRFPKIKCVGIPRILTKQVGTRREAVEYVKMVAPQIAVHLFGFSDNMVDDFLCAKMPGIMGIDSAVPIRADWLMMPTHHVPSRDPKWFDEGSTRGYLPTLEDNVNNVRKWVGGSPYFNLEARRP